MLGYERPVPICINVTDPGADKAVPLFRAPKACEIVRVRLVADTTTAAATDNYYDMRLLNYGTAGTAVAGTITNYANGGTAGAGTAGWTANTAKAPTVVEGTLSEGQWVVLDYNEEGTVAPGRLTVQFDVIYGVGA